MDTWDGGRGLQKFHEQAELYRLLSKEGRAEKSGEAKGRVRREEGCQAADRQGNGTGGGVVSRNTQVVS